MRLTEKYTARECRMDLEKDNATGGVTRVTIWGPYENADEPIFRGDVTTFGIFVSRMVEFNEKANKFAKLEIPKI